MGTILHIYTIFDNSCGINRGKRGGISSVKRMADRYSWVSYSLICLFRDWLCMNYICIVLLNIYFEVLLQVYP